MCSSSLAHMSHEQHDNSMQARTLGAICLGPTGNIQGAHWFMSLTSGARIIRYRWTELPVPADVLARVNGIAQAQGMPIRVTYSNRRGEEIGDNLDDLADPDDDDLSYAPSHNSDDESLHFYDSDDESTSSASSSSSSSSDSTSASSTSSSSSTSSNSTSASLTTSSSSDSSDQSDNDQPPSPPPR